MQTCLKYLLGVWRPCFGGRTTSHFPEITDTGDKVMIHPTDGCKNDNPRDIFIRRSIAVELDDRNGRFAQSDRASQENRIRRQPFQTSYSLSEHNGTPLLPALIRMRSHTAFRCHSRDGRRISQGNCWGVMTPSEDFLDRAASTRGSVEHPALSTSGWASTVELNLNGHAAARARGR